MRVGARSLKVRRHRVDDMREPGGAQFAKRIRGHRRASFAAVAARVGRQGGERAAAAAAVDEPSTTRGG